MPIGAIVEASSMLGRTSSALSSAYGMEAQKSVESGYNKSCYINTFRS